MTDRSRLLSLLAAGLSAGALGAVATPVLAQSAPLGSYAASCSVETSSGGWLAGYCRTDDGGRRWSSIRYVDCRGDISNRNGVLACRGATATEGAYYPPDSPGAGGGQNIVEAIAGAILGQVLGVPSSGELYQDGYRYPAYGQSGYGDPRYDARYGQYGWGYGRDRQWVPIIDRSDWFEQRIEAGRRQGRLSEREITSLRTELRRLVDLERDYARGGLSTSERVDLDRRFDDLAARIRIERRDDGGWTQGWRPVVERRVEFEAALEAGVRAGRLTRNETSWLRGDFDALVRQEVEYGRDGLDRYEQQSLDSRYQDLLLRTGADAGVDAWLPISSRAPEIERAIEEGRRNGRYDRYQADRFRSELSALLRLEAEYGRDGLSDWEREQLDRRHADLAARVGVSTGGGYPPATGADWPVASQRSSLQLRIDAAERSGRLSRSEATRLRTELDDLLRLEEGYASDGLSEPERSYLRYRIDALSVLVPR